MLLHRFIGSIEVVRKNKSDVYSGLFQELCKDGLIKGAMIRGLDQKALRRDLHEMFPLQTEDHGRTVH